MPMRLVLDTNIWLDWLVFDDPGVAPIKASVEAGGAEIFITEACEQELARVLAYTLRKKVLDTAAQTTCLAQFRRAARIHTPTLPLPRERGRELFVAALPVCKDPDDQKFLELARDCLANFLVTKDRDLLVFARRKYHYLTFRIVTPAQFTRARSAA